MTDRHTYDENITLQLQQTHTLTYAHTRSHTHILYIYKCKCIYRLKVFNSVSTLAVKQYFCFDFTISSIFLYSAGFGIAPAAMAASKGKGTSESGSFAPVYVTYPSENVATHSPTYAQVAAADSTPQKQGSHSKGKEKGKKK